MQLKQDFAPKGPRVPTDIPSFLSRRTMIRVGGSSLGIASAAGLATALDRRDSTFAQSDATPTATHDSGSHNTSAHNETMIMPTVMGEVDHIANGFNPTDILTDFDWGTESTLPDGRTLREYRVTAYNRTIEVVPGITFNAWTYNGRVPGPTFRAREGDRLRIHFTNGGDHHHSMHFHGVHPGNMDGVFDAASGQIAPGEQFTYEFDAEPFGVHLYHCHTAPLAAHIAAGLYGAFIVDPKDSWPAVDHEMVMVMSGFDLDFDGANDVYSVNAIPFHYDHDKNPIRIRVGESVRIFLINILEYDLSNSFHLHANFFNWYPTGTSRTPSEFTDTVALMQGQRGMMEFSYRYPGRYMFHAHKTEFAELGWSGIFLVEE